MAEMQDPLAELRDIHLPAPPDLWPPAPGWWIAAVLIIGVILYGLYLGYKIWRRNAYRRQAVVELEALFKTTDTQDAELLANLNALLKRVALSRFPREEVANLSGESWVAYLDSKISGHEFTMGPGQVLIDGPYSNHDNAQINRADLERVSKLWILSHREVAA